MKLTAINKFAGNINKLLNEETVDLYESMIDSHFEYIAAEILSSQLQNGIWFDGTGDLKFNLVKPSQIEFSGNMLVCLNQEKRWKEPFFAIVSDERLQGNGMPIFVRVGEHEGEGDLFNIVWFYKNT